MLRQDEQRLEHILEYCESITECVVRFGDSYETFHADKAYHDLMFGVAASRLRFLLCPFS